MIPRYDLYTALCLAFTVASTPADAAPINGSAAPRPELEAVVLDFWPNKAPTNLRIVGCNGPRLVCVAMHYAGDLPSAGKFVMPLEGAARLIAMCSDSPLLTTSEPVSLMLVGADQLVATSGEQCEIVQAAQHIYPEYNETLSVTTPPDDFAIYDMAAMRWAMEQMAPLADGFMALYPRKHGASLFQPRLAEGRFTAIQRVTWAIKSAGGR